MPSWLEQGIWRAQSRKPENVKCVKGWPAEVLKNVKKPSGISACRILEGPPHSAFELPPGEGRAQDERLSTRVLDDYLVGCMQMLVDEDFGFVTGILDGTLKRNQRDQFKRHRS
eukprot:CAMPEP_0177400262 /NCGR_PEP_ID=MMETSP0368-20130122/58988_1 /TAXON_ID=447022 ORGANISM="Scrippsiella hangoei-like, Strain SHHI-4" /NCGR_SAMPLE_ID=MMETSP0368 /ASSEMBLY_ACC=CAM_ASM_000363 /LENGTH=113 /DNA_ID=CAMNT_0018867695 /DNA_START=367 /DNA_END=708 /DNA_ORIENTATION=-